jgi:hypothetical protein
LDAHRLRDDRDLLAEHVQVEFVCRHAVEEDRALGRDAAQKGQRQRGLAAACAADCAKNDIDPELGRAEKVHTDADAFARFDGE